MAQSNRNPAPKYVYDLPYFERMELCRILDHNDKWEELGGVYMHFDVMTIQVLRREVLRGNSPTDELLTKWGHQNHTILELFVLLSKMQHYQAMLVLKPFVEPEYHLLIYEGEQNLSRIFKQKRPSVPPDSRGDRAEAQNVGCTDKINEAVNMNFSKTSNLLPDKISFLNGEDADENSERKILNNEVQPGPSIKENGSRRSNAQTVLVNHMDNAMALEPSDIQQPKLSIGKDNRCISEISSIAESVGTLPVITFKDLEIATNGWDPSTILGRGGFGTVYKGTWKNTQVAIKRTRNNDTDENHTVQIQQILGELKMLNSYRHDNILPLYGFSMGGEDPCLIYQYMPNGSLEDRLQCRQGTKPLSWFQRHNIATGTARGLQFLHTIGEKPLIHGDIKSANILLDSNFEPKIGDFGLAREGPYNHYTHMKVSKVHGTRPYLPDEFLRAKKFSTKVDTHSFGIVLFELATGLRAYDEGRKELKFLKDLIENSNETQLSNLVDRKCGLDEHQTFTNLITLGKFCISKKPKDRPEMVSVLQELNAMAVKRDMLVKVQSMIRQNSLTPSNPYEMQMLHDHLSQQRKTSPSPSNNSHFRTPSPNQPSTSHSPNNPFLPPNEDNSRNRSPSPYYSVKTNGSEERPESNKSSAKLWNTGIVPPHILQRLSEEQNKVTPSISVSPPSAPESNATQSEVDSESRISQNQDDLDYAFMSNYDNNVLPLISALGIKAKSDETKEPEGVAGPPEEPSAEDLPVEERPVFSPPQILGAVGGTDDVSTSAKGKPLWIFGDG